jgi:hypothetical protein
MYQTMCAKSRPAVGDAGALIGGSTAVESFARGSPGSTKLGLQVPGHPPRDLRHDEVGNAVEVL